MKTHTESLPETRSNRMALPDVLKGLAVLLMIQVHLTELFAVETWFNSMAGQISLFLGGPPAAPVFMVVMGYFIAKGNKSLLQNIRHGFKLIFWGLLLNLGMNAHLLTRVFLGEFDLNPFTYIFGVDILFLAGLSVLVIALLRNIFRNKLLLWLLALVFFAIMNSWLPVYSGEIQFIKYVQAYFFGYYHWSYFPLFPWAAYPLAGYIFKLLEDRFNFAKISEKHLLFVAITLLIILVFSFDYGFVHSTILQVYYHHEGLFVVWTLAFVLFWTLTLRLLTGGKTEGFFLHWLQWTGKNVTAFYVFQWLIIGNVATSLYRSQYLLQLILWFLVVTALSSLLVLLWKKMKKNSKPKITPENHP
ncbi:MAG: heparan-alpha-glucosaminide N-acetyltransferase domain-containing protein [Bacteroidales bacterium]|nr:heparan-alpha-glucosaminide N-acetyltransferase domain-containing protein [Bacteroidales bacterium]